MIRSAGLFQVELDPLYCNARDGGMHGPEAVVDPFFGLFLHCFLRLVAAVHRSTTAAAARASKAWSGGTGSGVASSFSPPITNQYTQLSFSPTFGNTLRRPSIQLGCCSVV